jgi:hypothetical protein
VHAPEFALKYQMKSKQNLAIHRVVSGDRESESNAQLTVLRTDDSVTLAISPTYLGAAKVDAEENDEMKVRTIAESKSGIGEHWKNLPAAVTALKIINAIESKETPETKWRTADILGLLNTEEITSDAIAALAILTQSEYAIFRACGEFIDEENHGHRLSSEEFQRVMTKDVVLHPVTHVEVTRASERVVPFFELEAGLIW